MKSWKALVFFLLLNVLVSACVTLIVLYIWDQNRGLGVTSLLPPVNLLPDPNTAPINQESPVPATEVVEVTPLEPTETYLTYEVQVGDDFSSIAAKYEVDVDELIAINGFTTDQPLGVGEILRIPYEPTPVPEGVVQIRNVVGAGDLGTERVLLKFVGEGELTLVGWRLEDENSNVFLFPQTPRLTLYEDGAVYIFTKPGINSAIELFWGSEVSIWQSGETVTLRDADGNVRATYLIP